MNLEKRSRGKLLKPEARILVFGYSDSIVVSMVYRRNF